MNEKTQRHPLFWIFFFILFSLLLHSLIGFIVHWLPSYTSRITEKKEETKVVWIKPEVISPPKEIADIEKPLVEKKPNQSRFTGQYNSSVKEEMVARPKPKPKVIKENPSSTDSPKQKFTKNSFPKSTSPQPIAPVEKPEESKENSEKSITPDLSLKPRDLLPKEEKPAPKTPDPSPSGTGLTLGRPSAPDLFQHDYYPDYKVGGKTYLNVEKMGDAAYIAKMKRILKMRWSPIASVRNYLTINRVSIGKIECVLGVEMDESGKIANLIVIRSSGVPGYDQEALQTFRDSSPFSTPPYEYLKEGAFRMSWTFTVYL